MFWGVYVCVGTHTYIYKMYWLNQTHLIPHTLFCDRPNLSEQLSSRVLESTIITNRSPKSNPVKFWPTSLHPQLFIQVAKYLSFPSNYFLTQLLQLWSPLGIILGMVYNRDLRFPNLDWVWTLISNSFCSSDQKFRTNFQHQSQDQPQWHVDTLLWCMRCDWTVWHRKWNTVNGCLHSPCKSQPLSETINHAQAGSICACSRQIKSNIRKNSYFSVIKNQASTWIQAILDCSPIS